MFRNKSEFSVSPAEVDNLTCNSICIF
jgi:hypothetical protein